MSGHIWTQPRAALEEIVATVEPVLDAVQYVVIAAIVLAIAWYFWSKFASPKNRSEQPSA